MIPIVYIVSNLSNKGPIIILRNLIINLRKDLFTPIIITLSPESPNNSLKVDFEKLDVKIFSLNLNRFSGYIFGFAKLREFLKEIKPGIVHNHGFRPDIFIKKGELFPVVSTLHNIPSEDYTMEYGSFLGKAMSFFHVKALKKIDRVIACSKTIEESLKSIHNKISIQNGVEMSNIIRSFSSKQDLGLPLDKKIIISIGSLSKRKDPITVIDGFINSKAYYCSVLLFLGNGDTIDECKRRSLNHPNIIFKGQVDNVAEYLNCADLFVSASLSEGLPNAVLEAMLYKVPVCLSSIPQHKEILDMDSNAGKYFDVKNSVELSIKIDELLFSKDILNFQKAAYGLISNHFNASRMTKDYEELYLTLYERYSRD